MLLGIDIPNVQQIILVRPPNKEHSIVQVNCETIRINVSGEGLLYLNCLVMLDGDLVQAMGRAGRVSASGTRARTLLYILYNSQVQLGLVSLSQTIQDLGKNVSDMSDVVRTLCKSTDTCLKAILKRSFVGSYASDVQEHKDFCCNICDSQSED